MIETPASTYEQLLQTCANRGAVLVAVSKTKPVETIMELYALGQRDFGENYVQELVGKAEQLPQDIRWHFIGHLQRNKVKQLAPFVHLIHGVDSLRLLEEISRQGQRVGRIIDVLLQVHVADETTKFGLEPSEVIELLESPDVHRCAWARLSGLMGMTTLTGDKEKVRTEFRTLRQLHARIGKTYFDRRPEWHTLSMGMSGDFELALDEGSNMVRIGSLLFGARN